MQDSLLTFFSGLTFVQCLRDALDIFLVYYIVYRALLVLRGTRAMQVGVGLAMVFVLYIVAQVLQLVTVLNIMGALISSMILIIVVV
ncbi:MAG: TIGR00159 family protein, partial [Pseudomonadota bacterium]